jgi:hypothetical protein
MKPFGAIAMGAILGLLLMGCGGAAVPQASTKCVSDFRNDTQGLLTDADLSSAWARAQMVVANGQWVINAVEHPRCGDPDVVCEYMPPDDRALGLRPECLGVKGVYGSPDPSTPEAVGVTSDSHNIAIDLRGAKNDVWARASYEMENCIGIRLGFPMADR